MTAVANPRPFQVLPGSNGSDDTSALNAALASGGRFVGIAGQNYKISASLVIYSDTTLDMTGCTITLLAGSSSNMIHNSAWVAGSGRNSNIEIIGGTWARGSNSGTGQSHHSILMQRVDGLRIRNLTVTSSAGKYAINVYACTNFVVEEITGAVASDLVHINGACSYGRVSGVYGTAGDDGVAITANDYAAYSNGDLGDVTDIVIERVYVTTTSFDTVKILPGSNGGTALSVRRVRVRDIRGDTTTQAVYIGGDAGSANTQDGNVYDIELDGIANNGAGHTVKIALMGTGVAKNVACKRLACPQTSGKSALYLSGCDVSNLSVQDSFLSTTVAAIPINLSTGTVARDLTLNRVQFDLPASSYAIEISTSTSSVEVLRVRDSYLNVATQSGGLVKAIVTGATIGSIHLSDYVAGTCSWILGDFAISASVLAHGVRLLTATTGFVNVRSGATVTVKGLSGLTGATNHMVFTNAGTLTLDTDERATPTYSASITPALNRGRWQTITATDGSAFTINAPTMPPGGSYTRDLVIEVYNNSGGALGTITWNSAFVFAGASWTSPANGLKRFARFKWNGSKWVCTGVAGADY